MDKFDKILVAGVATDFIVCISMIFLKIFGAIKLSWLWTLSPIWIQLLVLFLIIGIAASYYLTVDMSSDSEDMN